MEAKQDMAPNEGDERKRKQQQQQLGGYRTMPFILANEICDRFATAGFNANMIQYLQKELHLPLIQATNTLTNFGGTASLTPIIGAFIADSFAGRFWTITVGSIIYQFGMLGVTISAIFPIFRPPPCPLRSPSCQKASPWQQAFFYFSLLLTAIGSGGLRPCVVAFGAEQFEPDPAQPNGPKTQSSFFNMFFFSMGFSVLLALTVVVYIQDNVGWGFGFGIPAMAMFVSVVVFVGGYPLYVRKRPGGSPFARLGQVVVAAVKKRKIAVPAPAPAPAPAEAEVLYENKELDKDISTDGRLLHTDQFRFFDRAAIPTPGDISASGRPNPWRLSTVHRVEELKSIIRMIPIWSVGILITTASSHNYTFTIIQANSMNRHLARNFHIPAATLSIFSVLSMLLTLAAYDRLLVPFLRRLSGRPDGICYLRRMAVGLAISLLSNMAAAAIETRRRRAAAAGNQISVFWLVPQYAVHGVADGFSSVAHMEFLYDQAPESMRSTAAAMFWLAASIGNYGGTVMVALIGKLTEKTKQGNWLRDDINRGRLDFYYWLVFGLQVLNFGYYLLCARFYRFKPVEIAGAGAGERIVDVELADVEVKGKLFCADGELCSDYNL